MIMYDSVNILLKWKSQLDTNQTYHVNVLIPIPGKHRNAEPRSIIPPVKIIDFLRPAMKKLIAIHWIYLLSLSHLILFQLLC